MSTRTTRRCTGRLALPASFERWSTMRTLTILMLLGTSLIFSGCFGLALMPERALRGRELPPELLAQLQLEMSEEGVVALLGQPARRHLEGTVLSLRYEEVRQLRGCRPMLLFIPLAPSAKRRTVLDLVFAHDALREVRLTVRTSGETTTRTLLRASDELGIAARFTESSIFC